MDKNANFGLPPEVAPQDETPEQRALRIKARADAIALKDAEEEEVQRLVAAARAERVKANLPPDETKLAVDTQGFPAEYDKVVIFKGQGKNDLSYVPIGINGFVIKAPRGEEIIIPHVFTQVLENAVEEVTIQSQGGLITRPAHRFPYQIRGRATPEEYKAYQMQQRSKAQMQEAAQR